MELHDENKTSLLFLVFGLVRSSDVGCLLVSITPLHFFPLLFAVDLYIVYVGKGYVLTFGYQNVICFRDCNI